MTTADATLAARPPLRACMLAYTFYDTDGRVQRYAEALAQSGADVEAIVLGREGQAAEDLRRGVRVLRIQRREKNERSKYTYLWRLLRFFVHSMAVVTRRHLAQPYDVIHVHSVPDFEVFAAWLPKLLGAKVVLDIHDIVPEFYAAKFGVPERSAVFALLKRIEKTSAWFADHVIVANDLWLRKIVERSCHADKCTAFINYPDAAIFHPALRQRRAADGRFLVVYPGSLNVHQGLDIAIRAVALLRDRAPDLQLHIHGEGSARDSLWALVDTLALHDRVFIWPPLPIHEIAVVMADADLGVVPKRNDAFGGDAFSTKTLEFMALGVPLVVADTRVDRHYFDDSLVRFFKAGDVDDLAAALLDAHTDRARSAQRAARALDFAARNDWRLRKAEYLQMIDGLVHG